MKKLLTGASILAYSFLCVAKDVELKNPSFEKGTTGYWLSAPREIKIDASHSSKGLNSILFQVHKNKKLSVVFGVEYTPSVIYSLTFDSKGSGNCVIQPRIMLQSSKPIMFWSSKDAKQLQKSVPDNEWSTFNSYFGPLPEKALGKNVKKVMIYFTVSSADGKKGEIWIDNIKLKTKKKK